MKIAVIGAGAMGSIYGGHLSQKNEVYLIDKNENIVDTINKKGITLYENGKENKYFPKAVTNSKSLDTMDLIILFVKALYSETALKENCNLIGNNTYLMTLQNGAGHEDILTKFAPLNKVIIGTTEDNGNIIDKGIVKHGGKGITNIGMITNEKYNKLSEIKEVFDESGFTTRIHKNIQQLIWDKLLINISLSAVTGILQEKMGFIANNEYAWKMTKTLVKEALSVAKVMNLNFSEDEILKKIKNTSLNNIDGCTSIYTDLKRGVKTEVDTISGAVLKAAIKNNINVPVHEFLINMVHAMESKK